MDGRQLQAGRGRISRKLIRSCRAISFISGMDGAAMLQVAQDGDHAAVHPAIADP